MKLEPYKLPLNVLREMPWGLGHRSYAPWAVDSVKFLTRAPVTTLATITSFRAPTAIMGRLLLEKSEKPYAKTRPR